MPDPNEVDAVPAKRLELAVRPPQIAAADRGEEMREVVPEPHHSFAQPFALPARIRSREGELGAAEDATLVHQRLKGADLEALQRPLPLEEQLDVRPVAQDEERDPIEAEVLEEQRLTDTPDQGFAPANYTLKRVVRRDCAQVDVRELVSLASSA